MKNRTQDDDGCRNLAFTLINVVVRATLAEVLPKGLHIKRQGGLHNSHFHPLHWRSYLSTDKNAF